MKSKLLNLALAVSASFALTSCGNEDLYDPSKAEAAWKEEYGAKFIAQYGSFGADHSWDASSLAPYYSAATRADGNLFYQEKEWYYVDEKTLDWLQKEVPDRNDNRKKGNPFGMVVPKNKFTIVPIYQGGADLSWDFYVAIGTGTNAKHIKVWSKSQDIEVYKKKGGWQPIGKNGNTEEARKVRAKGYTFDLTQYAGEVLYFYLKTSEEKIQSSVDGMMLNLDCERPSNISEENEVGIIGCEDTKNGDWDMSDVAFLMYGDPELPDEIDVTNKEIVENKTKRYMIEDLGDTDDFDFNDIVVDVMDVTTKKLTITNGTISNTEIIKEKSGQKAIIRHLGGVIPFTLKIGNTTLAEMEGQIGANPNTEHIIEGWIPDQNNISIRVKDQESGAFLTAPFPKIGEIPMMIATDPEVEWMEERKAITEVWFSGLRKQ